MIYFEVHAGLCNRLRGMASAYAFAKDTNQKLTVIWESDVNCNCKFDTLFNLSADIPVKVINLDCMGNGIMKKAEHQINKCRKLYMKFKSDTVIELREIPNASELKELKENSINGKNLYLKSCHDWYKCDNPFDIFKLQSNVKKRVDGLIQECRKTEHKCVGVHIRRTDHQDCIANSPTSAFIKAMEEEPDDTVFYIASDDELERKNLEKKFGKERIKYNNMADLSRGTIQGMEDAVVDLYVLAGMDKILGSEGSSFTDMAAMINGTPIVRCH